MGGGAKRRPLWSRRAAAEGASCSGTPAPPPTSRRAPFAHPDRSARAPRVLHSTSDARALLHYPLLQFQPPGTSHRTPALPTVHRPDSPTPRYRHLRAPSSESVCVSVSVCGWVGGGSTPGPLADAADRQAPQRSANRPRRRPWRPAAAPGRSPAAAPAGGAASKTGGTAGLRARSAWSARARARSGPSSIRPGRPTSCSSSSWEGARAALVGWSRTSCRMQGRRLSCELAKPFLAKEVA